MTRVLLAAALLSGWSVIACDRAPTDSPPSDAPPSATSSVEPPREVVHDPACPFEGCRLGQWTAREPVALYDAPAASTTERTVDKGQTVEAVSRPPRG